MFRVKPRANLGLIFFTVLIQNSEKQWKVLSGCLKNLPSGIPSGHQTFPRGCAPRESLMTLGNSLGQIFPDNHCGLSTVYTRVGPSLLSRNTLFTFCNLLYTLYRKLDQKTREIHNVLNWPPSEMTKPMTYQPQKMA